MSIEGRILEWWSGGVLDCWNGDLGSRFAVRGSRFSFLGSRFGEALGVWRWALGGMAECGIAGMGILVFGFRFSVLGSVGKGVWSAIW
jgi:hypothetical protein